MIDGPNGQLTSEGLTFMRNLEDRRAAEEPEKNAEDVENAEPEENNLIC